MKKENIGICEFCGKEKKLIKAHIIPRNFYLDYREEKYVSINADTGKFVLQQSGAYDKNILCEDCDSKILGIFDKEGYKILLDEVDKHPIFKEKDQAMYHLTHDNFNYGNLRKFFISILWRASISNRAETEYINLGPYEQKALEIIKGEREYENLFKILIFRAPKNKDYNRVVFIGKTKFGNCISYVINMASYHIVIIVNIKNFDYRLKLLYQNIFLSKEHLYVIESEIISRNNYIGMHKKFEEMWKKGFKPPKPKTVIL